MKVTAARPGAAGQTVSAQRPERAGPAGTAGYAAH